MPLGTPRIADADLQAGLASRSLKLLLTDYLISLGLEIDKYRGQEK